MGIWCDMAQIKIMGIDAVTGKKRIATISDTTIPETGGGIAGNVDGGAPDTIYSPEDSIDGGNP